MREGISPCLLLAESWNSFLQYPRQTSYVPQTKLLIFLHPHAVTQAGILAVISSVPPTLPAPTLLPSVCHQVL